MIAYKGFNKGLICRGYQFQPGENITEEANCAHNGFHSAENPLDCITYYGNIKDSVYCIVEVTGDMDEDDRDSKIASTELRIIKQLTLEELFLHALAFMVDHPKRTWSDHVSKDRATARGGFAVVGGGQIVNVGMFGLYGHDNPDGLPGAREAFGGRVWVQLFRLCRSRRFRFVV